MECEGIGRSNTMDVVSDGSRIGVGHHVLFGIIDNFSDLMVNCGDRIDFL